MSAPQLTIRAAPAGPHLEVYLFTGGVLHIPLTGDADFDTLLRAWAARGGLVAERGTPEGRRAA